MSAEGTLQIWDMANGKITYAQKRVAPKASCLAEPCSYCQRLIAKQHQSAVHGHGWALGTKCFWTI